MRFIFFYLLIGLIFGSFLACSPVHFSKDKTFCAVDNPCVVSQGLFHTQQDQLFTVTNKVDILVVDDNSGSMTTEQENLGQPFNNFISNLNGTGLDWQIGVTNTDVCPIAGGLCGNTNIPGARGRFMGPQSGSQPNYGTQFIISPATPNTATAFYNTVQRNNEVGSGDERGIYALNLAVDGRNDIDAGFFRDNSNLAVVILSDEDERSVGGNNPSDPAYSALESNDFPQTFMNKFQTVWGGTKALQVNAIVIKPGDSGCLSTQAAQGPYYTAHYGQQYVDLANMTNGVVGSICDNGAGSFANMLINITGAIHKLPTTNIITLNYVPTSTPTVTFDPPGNAVSWAWSSGTNQIVLSVRPADGTDVHVEYDFKQ